MLRRPPRSTLVPYTTLFRSRRLDFALVAVRAAPEALAAEFGFNPLIEAEGKAIVGEFVTIVQHPRGLKKQVALRENRIVDIPERSEEHTSELQSRQYLVCRL